MGREGDVHAVIDVEPLRMVVLALRQQGNTRHESPGLAEVLELERALNGSTVLDGLPVAQFLQGAGALRGGQFGDHGALPLQTRLAPLWSKLPWRATSPKGRSILPPLWRTSSASRARPSPQSRWNCAATSPISSSGSRIFPTSRPSRSWGWNRRSISSGSTAGWRCLTSAPPCSATP